MEIKITDTGLVTLQVQIDKIGIYDLLWLRDLDIDPPPPPIPVGIFTPGILPTDGILASNFKTRYVLEPKLKEGQRLSGIVTIDAKCRQGNIVNSVDWRILVDGIPQISTTIDTTQFSDGTHVIGIQPMMLNGYDARGGSCIVVINNSGQPFLSLSQQAIISYAWPLGTGGRPYQSLNWGRIDVMPNKAYPLNPQLDKHPIAQTDLDRQRMVSNKIWWVEGFNHIGTSLWRCLPILVKNEHGDLFVKQYNPQGGGSGVKTVNALPFVEAAPQYDGPRGIGWISPYTTLVADKHHRFPDGQTGWIGVDIVGRVMRVDITGNVETILGPRSVEGVIGTDPDLISFDLDDRIAAGEKEYVGDDNGLRLSSAQDIWVCESFPFEGVIADTGNNRIAEIQFKDRELPTGGWTYGKRLMRSWSIPDVTSVWGSKYFQDLPHDRIAWFAVNHTGLWCLPVLTDENDVPTGHGTVTKLADLDNAFWVRVVRNRVFILTLDHGIYEYVHATGEVIERKSRDPAKIGNPLFTWSATGQFDFCFMAIDEEGTIGPKDRIYWSHVASKTSMFWIQIDTWQEGMINRNNALINRQIWGSWTAINDSFGHYVWGIAPHSELSKFLACGITSSSWFLWTACLGDLPVLDDPVSYTEPGQDEWKQGLPDQVLAPSACWGNFGHGFIGWSADMFRDYISWDIAREPIRIILDPFTIGFDENVRENMAKLLFLQRTRNRF